MPSLADAPPPDSASPDPAAAAPDAASAPPAAAPTPLPSPFADVAAGSIPAVIVPPIPSHGTPNAVQTFTADNFDKLLKAGLDYHETKNDAVVLFNPKSISLEKIEAAEKAGTLAKVAQQVTALAAPNGAVTSPDAAATPAPADTGGGAPAPMPSAGALSAAPAPAAATPPGINNIRKNNLAAVPPNMPNPVAGQFAKRAV